MLGRGVVLEKRSGLMASYNPLNALPLCLNHLITQESHLLHAIYADRFIRKLRPLV